jgi:carboxynorspermidine decarboxylase
MAPGLLLRADIVRKVETPAFVIDERRVLRSLKAAARLRDDCGPGCKLLYALKPMCFEFALEVMAGRVDGLATSSLFESRLAREVLGDRGTVHVTTPGFRPDEIDELGRLCDHVAFNSLDQLRRFSRHLDRAEQVGLRVNPQLSLVADERYDPCRPHSKLGVPIDRLASGWRRRPELFRGLGGLQFHTNCDADDFEALHRTVLHLEERLGDLLSRVEWINVGGGYLFEAPRNADLLADCVNRLHARHGLTVYLEPGAGLVREAGCIIATVIDLFRSGGKSIAVLDTTVNHIPEVFEYQFESDVLGHLDDGDYEYLLAGCSCLAGDMMGEYAFRRPLRVGSRVVLANVGAYTMVKAHMFNGINLPTVYSLNSSGDLVLRRRYTYEDFASRFGVRPHAAL